MKDQKLHKGLVAAVVDVLENSFGQNQYVDRVIEKTLKSNRNWGSRDRAFIAESSYEIVRWWRLLWEIYGKKPNAKKRDLYNIFGIWWLRNDGTLPSWNEFDYLTEFIAMDLEDRTAITESFPEWLDSIAQEKLGDQWAEIAHNLNKKAPVVLRTNLGKNNRKELQNSLAQEGIETNISEVSEVGLVLKQRQNTFKSDSFQSGKFEIQDAGSQLIAPFLEVSSGQRVIDACAGAGGKSLHLSNLMNNKGLIISMDVEAWKLKELKKRAKRNGAHNIETRLIEGSKTIKRLASSADRLLLDVPCSGTGVIKRNPDTKWKISPENLIRVQKLQGEIINDYSKMLKKGGLMVYATCSILPSENEDQVQSFLASNPDFEFIKDHHQWPNDESDGFYMALIKRN